MESATVDNKSARNNVNGKTIVIDVVDETAVTVVKRKRVARRRWAILAKALKSPSASEPSSPTDEFSVRRISSFMLLTTHQLMDNHLEQLIRTSDNVLTNNATRDHRQQLVISQRPQQRSWYKYAMSIEGAEYFVVIGHRTRTFSAEDLMGFNNTGNVCIWPSEETLTYYVGANWHLMKGKRVLELGGGMSCLAGLMAAKYGGPHSVHLTDGNKISVENVRASMELNELPCPATCAVLKWGSTLWPTEQYDVILCADCLFFDEARQDLVETLWMYLAVDGLALVMAPKRGLTLDLFTSQCKRKGFRCVQVYNYNQTVWEKHLLLMSNCDYDDNIHYPILLELTKERPKCS